MASLKLEARPGASIGSAALVVLAVMAAGGGGGVQVTEAKLRVVRDPGTSPS